MLRILDNGLSFTDGKMRYAWFYLEDAGRRFYRCVALKELLVIPVSQREDYDLLGKQWGAVRGLHNAGVNFVYSALGIFRPDHVGVVQYYGAAGEGETEGEAAREALNGVDTVEAVLANFPQTKLGPPNPEWLQWYLDFVTSRAKYVAAILGHPDPRQGTRGAGEDGNVGDDSDSDLADEQNEILFRGLAKLRQNFVFQVLAEHMPRARMTRTLIKVAEVASNTASRQKGSVGIGFSLGIPLIAAMGQSRLAGASGGHGETQSVQDGISEGWGTAHSVGHSHSEGTTVTDGYSDTVGNSQMTSDGTSHAVSHGTSQSHTSGHGSSSGGGWSQSKGWNVGFEPGKTFLSGIPIIGNILRGVSVGYGQQSSVSGFGSHSSFSSSTEGTFESTSDATMHAKGAGQFSAHSEMHAVSRSTMETDSVTDTTSRNWGRSHAEGRALSQQASRMAGEGSLGAFSTGLLPGVNINRTWQTEDDVAERLTEVLRRLESLVNQASAEGGFMTNAFLFTDSEQGAAAGAALVPQAFHGPGVPTPVMTIPPQNGDEEQLRAHAFAFAPWNEVEDGDPLSGDLWTRYATMITSSQLAAYTAPGLFEEGSASTVMAEIPEGVGFYPNMPGDVLLGHQYSPETADLTTAQVRLSPETLMHTLFAGDTGFGKSVAAIRMAYESTVRWHIRTVVLDFGAGWRVLLNAPGLDGHVDILQLWPDAVRPMRWNPLQIGKHIPPETQWRAFADVFGGIAQLGVKRQKQEMLEALRKVYLSAGVLVDDPEVRADRKWGKVQASEAAVIGAPAGTALSDLNAAQRQALAVLRSKVVGLMDLYREVQDKLSSVPPRDTMLTGVLEGILFRLNPLVQGSAALQYAPGEDTLPVEELAKPWGIVIIEGGMFLDDFGKAFLLGWTGWHLYMDMVARRVHEITDEPLLQIFYEEANKIFVKEKGGAEDESGGVSASQRFADMFRDARKYRARLHVISQAPHLIADDIISSCSNLVIGFLKQPKDKDLVLSALARSEKGFRDEEWRRFVDDIPIGMAIGRFPYTTQREFQRPVLFRPLMLDVPEPNDEEIAARLGRIRL